MIVGMTQLSHSNYKFPQRNERNAFDEEGWNLSNIEVEVKADGGQRRPERHYHYRVESARFPLIVNRFQN